MPRAMLAYLVFGAWVFGTWRPHRSSIFDGLDDSCVVD